MAETSTDGLTRFTTEGERENIAGISLNDEDVDNFLEQMRLGLIDAAQMHDTAVQDNMGLRVETTVRLSRPVRSEDGEVVEHVGRATVEGNVRGAKMFLDPEKAPKV